MNNNNIANNDLNTSGINTSGRGNGKHILAEFYHCQCTPAVLGASELILQPLKEKVQQVGLTIVGEVCHDFQLPTPKETSTVEQPEHSSAGFTLTLLLAESHICIHTWGEHRTVTLDIYVCNFLTDNSSKVDILYTFLQDLFQPEKHNMTVINRNHVDM